MAFQLFLDVVKWYSCEDSRGMRYNDNTLRFFWLGKKLFGGKFLRFMAGPKNETDLLLGKSTLSPATSKLNFACPSQSILYDYNPMGMPNEIYEPGVIMPMIELKSESRSNDVSYVLMFDGKKIKRGADADLLGFEDGQSLKEREAIHSAELETVDNAMLKFKEMNRVSNDIAYTDDTDRKIVLSHIHQCLKLFSDKFHSLRLLQTSKNLSFEKLKDKCEKDPSQKATFEFAMDCFFLTRWNQDVFFSNYCIHKFGNKLIPQRLSSHLYQTLVIISIFKLDHLSLL